MKTVYKKTLIAASVLSVFLCTAAADNTVPVDMQDPARINGPAEMTSFEKEYLSRVQDAKLTKEEERELAKAQKWDEAVSARNNSFVNGKGTVVYNYGNSSPTIVCSIMQICDLEMESGENINSVNLGDPSRWSVEPIVTGSGATQTQHILIKPLDVGLETSMVVATDRRGYRIKLKSTQSRYMPHIAFSYPDKLNAAFKAQRIAEEKERERNSITTDNGSKTYLGNLNFNYKVDGNVSWKPVRVYDDGKKTIIEMPDELQYRTAPALMLLADKGGLFSDEVTEIVNYRMQDNRYIVDCLFDTAILTLDLDSKEQRVVITRAK